MHFSYIALIRYFFFAACPHRGLLLSDAAQITVPISTDDYNDARREVLIDSTKRAMRSVRDVLGLNAFGDKRPQSVRSPPDEWCEG